MDLAKPSTEAYLDLTATEITRSPEPCSVRTWHFTSFGHLATVLGVSDLKSACIFSDLTLGSWRGHWVGRELAAQLQLEEDFNLQPVIQGNPSAENRSQYANIVGKLIDNESIGDVNFNLSYRLAKKIRSGMVESQIKYVCVLLPRAANRLSTEDTFLLKLLADGFRKSQMELIFLLTGDCNPSGPWNYQLQNEKSNANHSLEIKDLPSIPGLFRPEWLKEQDIGHGQSIPLRMGHILIHPGARGPYRPLPEGFFLGKSNWAWMEVYKALNDPAPGATVSIQQNAAGIIFGEGAYDLALSVLEHAFRFAESELEQASVLAQAQNIRIALMRFKQAAAIDIPGEEIPPVFRASLMQSKAWGMVMTGKPDIAEKLFEKAWTILEQIGQPRLFMYHQNITALSKLRLGKIDEAFSIEKEIEKQLEELPKTDWQLFYVNSINQARLYKKKRDFTNSEEYYAKAFSATLGIRQDSDYLYTNFCFAQLDELQGNHLLSFIQFWRVVLCWLSQPGPEALAPRVASAVIGGEVPPPGPLLVEKVSEKLIGILTRAGQKLKISQFQDITPEAMGQLIESGSRVSFIQSDAQPCKPDFLIGNPGWSLGCIQKEMKPRFEGSNYQALSGITRNWIEAQFPFVDWSENSTFIVDHQMGCELPSDLTEVVTWANREGVSDIFFKGSKIQFEDEDHKLIWRNSQVRLAPGIDSFAFDEKSGSLQVHFKRYYSTVSLSTEDARIIQVLKKYPTIGEIASVINEFSEEELKRTIRNLEKRRILRVISNYEK